MLTVVTSWNNTIARYDSRKEPIRWTPTGKADSTDATSSAEEKESLGLVAELVAVVV